MVFRASTPIAFDAAATTALASSADAIQAVNSASANPIRHFLNMVSPPFGFLCVLCTLCVLLPLSALLLCRGHAVHLNFEHVIDANAVDAVGLRRRSGFRRAVYIGAVDHIIDVVARYPDFEGVGRLSARIRLLHGVARGFFRY